MEDDSIPITEDSQVRAHLSHLRMLHQRRLGIVNGRLGARNDSPAASTVSSATLKPATKTPPPITLTLTLTLPFSPEILDAIKNNGANNHWDVKVGPE